MTGRFLGGTLVCGIILALCPGNRSALASLLAGGLATALALLLGPRSIVERAGAVFIAGLIAWFAGPRAAVRESALEHALGWAAASIALAIWLHPRREDA